jgi:hypothetical protein
LTPGTFAGDFAPFIGSFVGYLDQSFRIDSVLRIRTRCEGNVCPESFRFRIGMSVAKLPSAVEGTSLRQARLTFRFFVGNF